MIKKSIIAIVVIIAAVGLVLAASGSTEENSSTKDSDNIEQQNIEQQNKITESSSENMKTAISARKAQEIAQKYIEEPEAKAGTPKLSSVDNRAVYIVPVILNGEQVGEIEIDAETGENLGGAGGAP